MITSTRNPRVVKAARLKQSSARRKSGLMLLEGPNVVAAALRAGIGLDTLFARKRTKLTGSAERTGIEVVIVSDAVMKRLADTGQPRGPVAVGKIPVPGEISLQDTIVLCGISDPGNAGTLIRSAAAFGFQVVATPQTVDVWSPKVLRSAAGAHFLTPIIPGRDPSDVAAVGVPLVALLAANGGDEPQPGAAPIGIMVGNEARGLPRTLVEAASWRLTIPTVAVESLNAAVAGSIAMFAVAQSRA